MTTVFAVDARNDLYLATDGRLALSTGLASVMQACAQAAKTQLGEMIYATADGLPNFATVWGGQPSLPQFEAYLRRTLRAVEGVTDVTDIQTRVANNTLSYSAVIQTVYGSGALNG